LELPHFFLADGADDDGDISRTPPNLSADELHIINDLLAQEAMRRKAASNGFLRVMVDGIQLAQINSRTSAVARFEVNDQAEVIEVYSSDEKGALLLATHLLNFVGPETQSFSITTEGGQQISFSIDAARFRRVRNHAQVAVEIKSLRLQRRRSGSGLRSAISSASFTGWWKPVAALSALALLCAGAWWIWSSQSGRNEIVSVAPTPAPTAPVIAPSPNQQTVQGPQRDPSPPPKPSRNAATPAPVMAQRKSDTPWRDETFGRAKPFAEHNATADPNEIATRGPGNRDAMGKPLKKFVDCTCNCGAKTLRAPNSRSNYVSGSEQIRT
jgi:hypothetical protein